MENILKKYVEEFNASDEECYKNAVDNLHAYEWLKEEIPLFECPDKEIERCYYFRYWTYRKHLKLTEDGYIITEFLPTVPWSGKHNAINAPSAHHIYEGRWLKNSKKYLSDYIKLLLDNPETSHSYSVWLIYALLKLTYVSGDTEFIKRELKKLVAYYEEWEKTHLLPGEGMFWSIDDRDAMEYSISGNDDIEIRQKGVRPTLNSYMCADAYALSLLAERVGEGDIAGIYREKHERLKNKINERLFHDGFYRALHYRKDEEPFNPESIKRAPREEIGYIPWMFNIPENAPKEAIMLLADEKSFAGEYGILTAERSHERFIYEVDHECLWNGYVWPFATSQTLYALINVIDNYGGDGDVKKLFLHLLKQYAASHKITREDGSTVMWIDEVRHPLRDEWSSRTILESRGWKNRLGGYERGKDYNHSTFCDIVISGIVGVKDRETLTVNPCIPESWDYFRLSRLWYRGKCYDITYDKSGERYGRGKGLSVREI